MNRQMREILFRGKDTDSGKWVDGYYVRLNGDYHRIYTGYAETDCSEYFADWVEIDPRTRGEYTGLCDKNGKRIFEGDIIELTNDDSEKSLYTVQWSDDYAGWIIRMNEKGIDPDIMDYWDGQCFVIIGNIHDNPELLRRG